MSACGYCGVDHDREDALAEHSQEITKLTAALAAAERRAEEAERERDRCAAEVTAVRDRTVAAFAARVEALEHTLGVIANLTSGGIKRSAGRGRAVTFNQIHQAARAALAAPAASPTPTPSSNDGE